MKIAFVSYQYPPRFVWGGSRYALEITNALEKLGVQVKRITSETGGFFRFVVNARAQIGDADLVHGNILSDALIFRRPCVTTMHHPIRYDTKDVRYTVMEYMCFRKARKVITDSNISKAEFERMYGVGKVISIPLGVEQPEKPEIGDPKKVLCAAGVGKRKGTELLCKIADLMPKTQFYITGGKDAYQTRNMHFLGRTTSKEKLELLYRECGICIITSLFEGFSLPILEGMAHKKAVVTTRVGIAPDAVNGRNGFVAERDPSAFAGIIKRLQTDRSLFEKVCEEGYRTSKGYTWAKTAKMTIRVYEEVLERKLNS
ncbi:glycosyltransferase family 4 protein [Candidatus Micrarchaeota archaeon]|nr:glycosyltransferase family 4 protein [Candidatus Micrarchaeota archaeon]